MKLIALRERFEHMGNNSGYDLLYADDGALSDRISFFRDKNNGRGNQIKYAELLKYLKINSADYRVYTSKIRKVANQIKGKFSYDLQKIADDLLMKYPCYTTLFYNKLSAVWTELEVLNHLFTHKSEQFLLHVSYGENQLGLLSNKNIQELFPNFKLVVTIHQPMSWWKLFSNCSLLENTNKIIVLSKDEEEKWKAKLPDNEVICLPHGIKTDYFIPNEQLKSQSKRFVFSGQWLRDIELMSTIVQDLVQIYPDLQFDLIYPNSARSNPINQKWIYKLAQKKQVHFYAGISDQELLEKYQAAFGMILPLIDCTANNAILEALSVGLPIITSDLESLKTYLDTDCAYFVEETKSEGYLKAVKEIIASPQKAANMGHVARSRALALDWSAIQENTLQLFKTIA